METDIKSLVDSLEFIKILLIIILPIVISLLIIKFVDVFKQEQASKTLNLANIDYKVLTRTEVLLAVSTKDSSFIPEWTNVQFIYNAKEFEHLRTVNMQLEDLTIKYLDFLMIYLANPFVNIGDSVIIQVIYDVKTSEAWKRSMDVTKEKIETLTNLALTAGLDYKKCADLKEKFNINN
jgi:hypothetical protein